MKKVVAGVGILLSGLISLSIVVAIAFTASPTGTPETTPVLSHLYEFQLGGFFWILLIISLVGMGLIISGLLSKEK